jgi:hypothetical protein
MVDETMTFKPLNQGDQDEFCGFYSITNALTMMFPHKVDEDFGRAVFKALALSCRMPWPNVVWTAIRRMTYA